MPIYGAFRADASITGGGTAFSCDDEFLMSTVLKRNNVRVGGRGEQPMIFAHGYGCDQNMWRFVTPAFEETYKVILFDHVGHGQSDASAYDRAKYGSLDGYADDVLEICRALNLADVIFVGHSVSAMIGVIAAVREPDRFSRLVLIGPSPCYINGDDYLGGFNRNDIDGLLEFLDSNHLGWSSTMAPAIMGNADRPELGEELTNSFCRTDPDIAKHFARVTFHSDNRADLPKVKTKALVLQCSADVIAPEEVGRYVHRNLPHSEFVMMRATGHCPNLSAPEETVAAIRGFLSETAPTGTAAE
jgi:sigma-B regulation protein RsbQ